MWGREWRTHVLGGCLVVSHCEHLISCDFECNLSHCHESQTGSVVLLGFYTIVKYLGTDWINWLLSWYFSIVGIGSVWKVRNWSLSGLCCSSLAVFNSPHSMVSRRTTLEILPSLHVHRSEEQKRLVSCEPFEDLKHSGCTMIDVLSLSWRMPTVISFPLAFVPSLLYNAGATSRKSILVTDIFGFSFSHNALTLFKIDSFKTGSILLGGLFFYDIWWVFGTEVVSCITLARWVYWRLSKQMVQVATSLDVPIKLLWPKSLFLAGERGYTMLGLGDVVIPGTFIALALRYDYHRHLSGLPKVPVQQQVKFAKPYFHASLAAYILGLMTTMTAMHVFHTAQPALLYLRWTRLVQFICTLVDWFSGPVPLVCYLLWLLRVCAESSEKLGVGMMAQETKQTRRLTFPDLPICRG